MVTSYLNGLVKDITELRIALIATYPKMQKILTEFVANTPIQLISIHAQFEEAAQTAKDIEGNLLKE